MKTILFLLALMLLPWVSVKAQDTQNEAVIPFLRDGLWGLIDGTGRETLPPTFRELGWFSEGIAPARRGGYWGYINTQGQWAIAPQYTYATPFAGGLAVVWVDSFPIAINLTGQVVVPRGYTRIVHYENGNLLVSSYAGKQGIWSANRLVIDTAYNQIRTLGNGYWLAAVENTTNTQHHLFDATGNHILGGGEIGLIQQCWDVLLSICDTAYRSCHFATYTGRRMPHFLSDTLYENNATNYDIAPQFSTSYFYIRVKGQKNTTEEREHILILDTLGNQIGRIDGVSSIDGMQNGYFKFRYSDYECQIGRANGDTIPGASFHCFDEMSRAFSSNRILVRQKSDNWREAGFNMIDSTGRVLFSIDYPDVSFNDGFLIVGEGSDLYDLNGRTALMDSLGNWVVSFERGYNRWSLSRYKMNKNYWSAIRDTFIFALINNAGAEIFSIDYRTQQPQNAQGLNISTYYFWNFLPTIGQNDSTVLNQENRGVNLVVSQHTDTVVEQWINCRTTRLTNYSTQTINLDVRNTHPNIILQAKDARGRWCDILNYTHTCRNSANCRFSLQPGAFWEFTVPEMAGTIETEFRLIAYTSSLQQNQESQNPSTPIISNTWRGSVNPGQL